MQLLLAEDDPVLGRALQIGLTNEGLAVDWARSGRETLAICARRAYSALILDLGLPDMSGFEILHRIRQFNSSIPIVVVTARGAIEDRIRGLNFGADDYVGKPFELLELLARLRAVRRRVGHEHDELFTSGDVAVDLKSHVVTLRRRAVPIDACEFALLRLLIKSTSPLSPSEAARQLELLGDDIDEETIADCARLLQAKLDLRFEQNQQGWRFVPARTSH
jgi:DNA-binding response OmpR family regulator